jgi:carboxymethylenebutenolidase
MCFDIDSAPPVPAIAGASVSHELLKLRAADGNELAAFLATPDDPSATGIVLLPDVRGLYHFYEELALRFAERGHAALAIDYFGRTAGSSTRDANFEYGPHVDQTTDDGVQADTHAAVEHLRGLGCSSVFTVGFCFGGRASWVAAASGHGLAGSIGFYGSPTRQRGGPSAVERVDAIACPILALQAGDDQGITADDNATFDRALTAAGIEHEIVVYDGAPHSFFDRKQEEFADASEDAWRRTLAFVDSHA